MTRVTNVLVSLSPTAAILLKVSMLLAAGWAVDAVLRISRADARWRLFLWRGLMAGLLLVPAGQWIGGWEVFVEHPAASPMETAIVTRAEKPAVPVRPIPSTASAPATVQMPPAPDKLSVLVATPSFSVSAWVGERKPQLLLAGWLIGAGVMLLRSWTLLARIRRMRSGSRPAGPKFQSLLDRVAREMRSKKPVLLQFGSGLETPFLTGLRWPVIVLPDRMEGTEYGEDLPGVLAHEVAHLRARDLWWMALGRLVSTLLWFHPLAWPMRAAHGAACEEVCDAAAAQYVGNPAAYTSTLARVALAIVRPVPSAGGIPMARSSQIISRLRLLERGVRSNPIRRGRLFLCAMFGVVVFTGVACVRLAYAEGTAPGTPQVESKMWTKILQPRERILRVGFPLPIGESFVFDNPADVLQGSLTLRVIRKRTPEHASATYEYTIFENGKLAEGWKVNRPMGGATVGLNSQFFSTDRHLTAPDDVLDLELVAAKDLHGRGPIETGFLPAGTYKARGKYAALTDDFDSAAYLKQYVKDGEKPSSKVLEGLELTRAVNEWRAWLTDWNAEWPLNITAKGGWTQPAEQIKPVDEVVKGRITDVEADQRARMIQERKWRQEFIVADQGPEAACRVNLFEIMHALATYQEPHHDLYPPTLADLFPNYLNYPDALVCPSAPTNPPLTNGMPCSYRYLGSVLPKDAWPGLFVIYDRPANHGDGRNVGLFGGQIKFYKEAEFKKVLVAQYERLKPVIIRADFPGNRERVKAFFEDRDFPEEPMNAPNLR